jgi:hypothetical protein
VPAQSAEAISMRFDAYRTDRELLIERSDVQSVALLKRGHARVCTVLEKECNRIDMPHVCA